MDLIFIGGTGRSGSTLLDRVLGQLPGSASGGEVLDLWRAGLQENRLCGCGVPFLECPFWTAVGEEAFGGWAKVDAHRAEHLVKSFDHRLVLGLRRADPDADERADLVRRLYAGIAAVSGVARFVDSSKSPAYGYLLARTFPDTLRAIHLVRDCRGVAYSWSKVVKRPDTPGRDVEMLRLSPGSVAARWILHNTLMERLSARVPAARLRYESFLAEPSATLAAALTGLGEPDLDTSAVVDGDHVLLQPGHTVMGNPMRLAVGRVPLRLDDVWRREMPLGARALVTSLTWPWLARYGYLPG